MRTRSRLTCRIINQLSRFVPNSFRNNCGVIPISQLEFYFQKISQNHPQNLVRMSALTANNSSAKVTKGHIERTSDKPRDPSIHEVIVSKITNLSPTVKQIKLSISNPKKNGIKPTPIPFTFKAGQWVDLFVPGIPKIGGFTITSSPQQLQENGSLDLAIQYSDVQPAFWVHSKCQVGDLVSIRVGGDFYFDASEDHSTKGLLLLAGGVGINPLSAIIHHVHGSSNNIPIVLLYSAKNQEELIFRNEFDTLSAAQTDKLVCKYFLTAELPAMTNRVNTFQGRFKLDQIKEAVQHLISDQPVTLDDIKVYICGPPPMIHDMQQLCKELKIKNISYEKWW